MPKLTKEGGAKREEPEEIKHKHIRVSVERDRASVSGKCNGTSIVLARPNGASVSLYIIKNVGKCDGTLACVDKAGNKIADTDIEIKKGGILPIYVSPLGTKSIEFVCNRNENKDDVCEVEVSV